MDDETSSGDQRLLWQKAKLPQWSGRQERESVAGYGRNESLREIASDLRRQRQENVANSGGAIAVVKLVAVKKRFGWMDRDGMDGA